MKPVLAEAHIHDEPSREEAYFPGRRNLPKLSYKKAINSYLVTSSSEVKTVAGCTSEDFQDFVDMAIPTAGTNAYKCKLALKDLDYSELVARFFAINELLSYGAIVHLFACREDAILEVSSPSKRKKKREKA